MITTLRPQRGLTQADPGPMTAEPLLTDNVITVPIGNGPFAVAITPDGRHVYVTNETDGTVSVIDAATLSVTATVSVGSGPAGAAITPDGSRAYVTNENSNTISVINTATNTVSATVSGLSAPIGVAITPDGRHAYVVNNGAGTVSVIDTATNTITATVSVGSGPTWLAITPDGRHAYVANFTSNDVSVIDTATNTVTATIGGFNGPLGVAVTPDGAHAYVTDFSSNAVRVVDTATNTITGTTAVGTNAFLVAFTPDGLTAYVTNHASSTVSVIDTTSNTVTATIGVGNAAAGVAVTPNGLAAYVANHDSNTVSVILTLNAVSPNHGPTAGGTVVTITGTNLSGATSVQFGTRQATIIGDTPSEITVISPPGTGTVPITVTTLGGTSNPKPFYYISPPTVTSLTPASGPLTGGNLLTITGTNLATAGKVTFGTAPVTPTVVSNNEITVTAPPGASAGPVLVTITTAGGTATLTYTYVAAPTISGLSPATGPTSGGTTVTVSGTGFSSTDQVTFAGILAPFAVVSDGEISVVTPAGAAGPADVTVVTAGGSVTATGAYTYTAPPGI